MAGWAGLAVWAGRGWAGLAGLLLGWLLTVWAGLGWSGSAAWGGPGLGLRYSPFRISLKLERVRKHPQHFPPPFSLPTPATTSPILVMSTFDNLGLSPPSLLSHPLPSTTSQSTSHNNPALFPILCLIVIGVLHQQHHPANPAPPPHAPRPPIIMLIITPSAAELRWLGSQYFRNLLLEPWRRRRMKHETGMVTTRADTGYP